MISVFLRMGMRLRFAASRVWPTQDSRQWLPIPRRCRLLSRERWEQFPLFSSSTNSTLLRTNSPRYVAGLALWYLSQQTPPGADVRGFVHRFGAPNRAATL